MAFLKALRRDLAGGRAAGIGERGRMHGQGSGKVGRVDETLGDEEQREAGIDRCGLLGDRCGKEIGIGLVAGERRQAACVARP